MAAVSLNKKDAKAAEDLTAPEDFIGADQTALRQLDHAARCSICYELFASPVLLSGCFHSFCSSCIRVHLDSNPGKPTCPACGASTSETALKPNKALEEMTQKWSGARALVLNLVIKANKQEVSAQSSSSSSRKRANADTGDANRTKRRKGSSKNKEASSNDSDLEIVASPKADDPNIDVDCPMCGKTMKNSAMAKHINKCNGDAEAGGKSQWEGMKLGGSSRREGSSQAGPKKMNRISAQQAIGEIRDKLKEISMYGQESSKDKALSKEALVWRYNQYAILYNANQDASEAYRRKPSVLRKQVLEEEKKAQQSATSSANTHSKVNLSTHAQTYEDQFAMLTRQARGGKSVPSGGKQQSSDEKTQQQREPAKSPSAGPIEIQDSDSDSG